jgi:hypothetical protein
MSVLETEVLPVTLSLQKRAWQLKRIANFLEVGFDLVAVAGFEPT